LTIKISFILFQCYNCNQLGHYASNCTEPEKQRDHQINQGLLIGRVARAPTFFTNKNDKKGVMLPVIANDGE
jgi:hypothetical protein